MPAVVIIEDDDPDYIDLEKAEKKAKKILKKNHYRIIDLPPCCRNCRYSDNIDPYDGDYCCDQVDHSRWLVGSVSLFGLCDKYERMK